jgi:hypothetical protein
MIKAYQMALVKIIEERMEKLILEYCERKILSDLYQFIKLKVPTELLKDSHNKIISVVAEIAKDFQLEGNQLTVTTDNDPKERQFVVTIVKKINGKIPRQPVFSNKSEIKNGQKVVIAK